MRVKRGKRYRTERMQTALGYSVLALILAALALLTVGCRATKNITERVEVPVYIHDTMQSVKTQRDSVYVDRWHTEYVKGENIYIVDSQITVKYITRTDTAYKVVEKPVEVVKEQIKEVTKPLSKWHKCIFFCGLFALLAVFAWLTVRIISFCREK